MERDAGAQVASPAFFFHPGLFHDSTLSGKKREPPWQNPSFRRPPPQISSPVIPTPSRNWNPDQWDWDWDSRGFAAKPTKLDGENLSLKLGGGDFSSVEEPVPVATVRPNKRVRTGSPGSGGGYPMCQVGDCRADLSGAKDYNCWHKLCEAHSKKTNALMGKVMQRFCQQCSRTAGLITFPDYLVLHMRKFVMEEGWVPKKLDVYIDVIDVSHMRSNGIRPGEQLLPEGVPVGDEREPPQIVASDDIVSQLASMGFNYFHCQKAAIKTLNAGVEEAMNWLLSHMEDPEPRSTEVPVDEASIATLISFGFQEEVAQKALMASGGDIEKATDWIFSHPEDSGSMDTDATSSATQADDTGVPDGNGRFNCGEAANFATPQWLNIAKEAAVRRAAMNYPPMLSHQHLLYLLTMSFVSRI